jgi:hypothetical protein
LAITLTGSDPTGRSVASAGQNLKKTVMELGGSDAYIILDDVDLEATDLATLDDYKTMDKPVLLLKDLLFMMQSTMRF